MDVDANARQITGVVPIVSLTFGIDLPGFSSDFPVPLDPTDVIGLPSDTDLPIPPTTIDPNSAVTAPPEPPATLQPPLDVPSVVVVTSVDVITNLNPPGPTTQPTPLATPPPSVVIATDSITTTENVTTIITSVNGKATTITSRLPTALANAASDGPPPSRRTTIIAGATAAAVILVLGLLACIFAFRRHALRRREALARGTRGKEGRGLLDGEGFDEDEGFVNGFGGGGKPGGGFVPPPIPTRVYMNMNMSETYRPPSLLRARMSDSGSVFREEGVWPPPGEGFGDPIVARSSMVDLSRIVDDVMGPAGGAATSGEAEKEKEKELLLGKVDDKENSRPQHKREMTSGTTTSTLSTSTRSMSPLVTINPPAPGYDADSDPFSISPNVGSVYYIPGALPPGAGPPLVPGSPSGPSSFRSPFSPPLSPPAFFGSRSSPPSPTPSIATSHYTPYSKTQHARTSSAALSIRSSTSNSNSIRSPSPSSSPYAYINRSTPSPPPPGIRSLSPGGGPGSTQPKKSSPLARALSGDARIWLGRHLTPKGVGGKT